MRRRTCGFCVSVFNLNSSPFLSFFFARSCTKTTRERKKENPLSPSDILPHRTTASHSTSAFDPTRTPIPISDRTMSTYCFAFVIFALFHPSREFDVDLPTNESHWSFSRTANGLHLRNVRDAQVPRRHEINHPRSDVRVGMSKHHRREQRRRALRAITLHRIQPRSREQPVQRQVNMHDRE